MSRFILYKEDGAGVLSRAACGWCKKMIDRFANTCELKHYTINGLCPKCNKITFGVEDA